MNKKDCELVNKEFRTLNRIINELEEEAAWLRRLLIISFILIVILICVTNNALTGSVL